MKSGTSVEDIEVPPHFICPISLQLMADPVIVVTGITYDREGIDRWLHNNNSCPVTKQTLSNKDLTANHTLRRLIKSWCTLNAWRGIEQIPTPKQPLNRTQIAKILSDPSKGRCLQNLRSVIVQATEMNKKSLEEGGVIEFLTCIIVGNVHDSPTVDEALALLHHLDASVASLKKFMKNDDECQRFLTSFVGVLECGSHQSRGNAIMILKSILEVADPTQLIGLRQEIFKQIVCVLRDKVSQKASKAALKVLVEVCPWGKNRIKAVEAGAVSTLIELLLGASTLERRECELIMVVLDRLCSCAEGRSELLKHGAGLAIVSKKILRVSHAATDRAVRILSSISKLCTTSRVLQEMLQIGVVSKLCLVLQVDTNAKTKERASEILKLHSRVWKSSPCIPAHFRSAYPS